MRKLVALAATLLSLVIFFPIFYSISASFFTYTDFTS
ncbi:MAG: carbohydrate ABC transporter permease, partial [Spirochaetia bacterium]|nr:carbohydrate ABC transporter permease [Spirochaetia bacterium]